MNARVNNYSFPDSYVQIIAQYLLEKELNHQYLYTLILNSCFMSNTHISVKVLGLLKDIRNLEGALEKKTRTELDKMFADAMSSMNWIQDQARDHNADLSPYISELDQVDIELNRLKGSIKEIDHTFWEAVVGIF